MLTVLKIAGLSALLSAGIVTAYEAPKAARLADTVKLFHDRVDADLPAHVPAKLASVRLADMSGSVGSPEINRAGKGDLQVAQASTSCTGQTWPYVSRDCVSAERGAPVRKAVRVISLESREGHAASTLGKVEVRR